MVRKTTPTSGASLERYSAKSKPSGPGPNSISTMQASGSTAAQARLASEALAAVVTLKPTASKDLAMRSRSNDSFSTTTRVLEFGTRTSLWLA